MDEPLLAASAPHDKKHIALRIFLLLGMGTLLPWNAVLIAMDFFKLKMPHFTPSYTFPFSMNLPNILLQVVIVKYGYLLSLTVRMLISFSFSALVIIALPFSAAFLPEDKAFWVCNVLVGLSGAGLLIIQQELDWQLCNRAY